MKIVIGFGYAIFCRHLYAKTIKSLFLNNFRKCFKVVDWVQSFLENYGKQIHDSPDNFIKMTVLGSVT